MKINNEINNQRNGEAEIIMKYRKKENNNQ
jgi:hypothetical protein